MPERFDRLRWPASLSSVETLWVWLGVRIEREKVTQAFTVAHSHYAQEINLEVMSQGFAPVYEDAELDEMEKAVTPLARNLADKLKEEVLPSRK